VDVVVDHADVLHERGYVKFGATPAVADEQSTMLLTALEGALILARARRSTEPLDTVERYFASRAPDPRTVDPDAHSALG
jgi:hypothetical protein